MQAITVENVSKIYPQGKKAVNNVSFTISQGEIYGFLGPNGAGKTTTVKLLNGMLLPSGGSCSVFGLDPGINADKVHQLAGVVTEHAQMYSQLTGFDNLLYYGALFGVPSKECQAQAIKLLDELGLMDAKDQKLSTYSTGMRQRLSLARAMVHRPKILFLDEPTSGLDPESAQNVNNMIKRLAEEEGITVFLCTHQLRYAQEICNRYGLIDQGEMLAAGSLRELRNLVRKGLTVIFHINGQRIEKQVQSEEEIPLLVKKYVEAGDHIYRVEAHALSLEDIYFTLIDKRRGFDGEHKAGGNY